MASGALISGDTGGTTSLGGAKFQFTAADWQQHADDYSLIISALDMPLHGSLRLPYRALCGRLNGLLPLSPVAKAHHTPLFSPIMRIF
ncbi:MAG: hypothetical protein LBS87_01605, partial [Puniceicoccales bacterium]|nr:hypothetical protein [Puniceicoccales bacterium]